MLSPLGIKDKLFYGWVIVISVLIIGTITIGTRNSYGVFFKSLESEFDLTRAVTSGVFSICMLLSAVLSILGGWALDRYGPRLATFLMGLFTCLSFLATSQTSASWQLFISYSLLFSLGTGAAYTVLMSTVLRWFDRKRGLALGVAGSGGSIGLIAVAPFATYLILDFGWRMAFIVIGVISGLAVMSLSTLLRKDPAEIGVLPDGARVNSGEEGNQEDEKEGSTPPTGFSLVQAIRNIGFWSMWAIWLCNGFCLFLVFTHLVPHATDTGISAMAAATVLSLMAGTSMLGRLVMGIISDRIGRRVVAITCATFMAGAVVWLIWSDDLWMFYLFAVVYGFAWGGLDACIVAMVGDVFGMRSIGAIIGTLSIGFSIGSAIGPFIGGLVFDVSNSYSVAFAIGAACMLVTASLLALTRRQVSAETK